MQHTLRHPTASAAAPAVNPAHDCQPPTRGQQGLLDPLPQAACGGSSQLLGCVFVHLGPPAAAGDSSSPPYMEKNVLHEIGMPCGAQERLLHCQLQVMPTCRLFIPSLCLSPGYACCIVLSATSCLHKPACSGSGHVHQCPCPALCAAHLCFVSMAWTPSFLVASAKAQ